MYRFTWFIHMFIWSKRGKFCFIFSKWKITVPRWDCNRILFASSKKICLGQIQLFVQKRQTWCSLMLGLMNRHLVLVQNYLLCSCKNQKRRMNMMGWSDYRLVCILRNGDMSLLLSPHTMESLENKCDIFVHNSNLMNFKPDLWDWVKSLQDQLRGPYLM